MRKVIAIAVAVVAATVATAAEDVTLQKLRATLTERFPKAHITDVRAAQMPGLFEVVNDGEIAYSDAKGDYLILGQLLETRTQRNLTRARLEEVNAVDFNSLPLDLAIKTVRGTGARKLAVFADPDCPYCQQLEPELAAISDITIYTFLLPLTELHPDALHKAQLLWCAPDRSLAWSAWMLRHEMASEKECGANPIAEIAELAKKLRINSTPTLFSANGRRAAGSLKKDRLEEFLVAKAAQTAQR